MPSTTLNLDALANRVMGLTTPVRIRRRRPSRGDRILALAMVVSTAVATVVSIGLAAQGQPETGLRVFSGCILANFCVLCVR
jgi:hypothetical protein